MPELALPPTPKLVGPVTPILIERPTRRDLALLGLLLAVGCGMSLYLAAVNPNLGSDSLGYLLPVRNLMAGQGMVYQPGGEPHLHFPPGLGLLAWALDRPLKDMVLSGMLVSVFSYLGIILLGWRAASQAWGPRAGILAAGLLTFFPALISSSYVILSEALFTFLLLAALVLWLRLAWREGAGLPTALALGATLGYAYLTRPEAFLPGLLTAPAMLLLPRKTFSRRLVLALATLLAFLAVCAPYLLYLRANLGFFALSGKTAEVFMRTGRGITQGEDYLDRTPMPSAQENAPQAILDFVRRDQDEMILRVKNNIVITYRRLLNNLAPALEILGLLALAWLAMRRWRGERWNMPSWRRAGPPLLAGVIFLSPLPVVVVFLVLERYLTIYSCLLLLPLAGAMARLLPRVMPAHASWGLAGLLALIVALNLGWDWGGQDPGGRGLPSQPATISQALTQPHGNLGVRAAGLWLAGQVGGRSRVSFYIPRKGWVAAFYANGQRLAGPSNPLEIGPDLTIEQAARALAAGEVDYLILDNHYHGTRPRMAPLWDHPDQAGRWGLKLSHADPKGRFLVFVWAG